MRTLAFSTAVKSQTSAGDIDHEALGHALGEILAEPAVDLAVAASILSSYKDVNIGQDTALFGEVGLTGEIRRVVSMDLRLKECERMGIKRVFCPRGVEKSGMVEVTPLKNVKELFEKIG